MGRKSKDVVVAKMEVDDEGADVSTVSEKGVVGEPSTDKDEYNRLCALVNEIASPLADRKTAKKLYKLVKKAATTDKKAYGRGVADVQRMLRKDVKGIVLLAGNVSPVDVYAHIAGVCEEKQIPYCYVPSREHLGMAAGQRRSSIVCLIQPNAAYQKLYDEVADALRAMPPPA